jgi:hypothetical protein
VEAFVEWRAWLIDMQEEVVVFSDHANLRYFMLSQHLSDLQARWAAYLTSFNLVIKHVAGKLDPVDPPTRRTDFLLNGKDAEDHSWLFQELTSGWQLRDSSLDIAEERIDIGEVASSPSSSVKKPDIDIFFCAPLKELKALLLKAYADEPPHPAKDHQLEQREDMWWIQGQLFVPMKLRPRILKEYHDSQFQDILACSKHWTQSHKQ